MNLDMNKNTILSIALAGVGVISGATNALAVSLTPLTGYTDSGNPAVTYSFSGDSCTPSSVTYSFTYSKCTRQIIEDWATSAQIGTVGGANVEQRIENWTTNQGNTPLGGQNDWTSNGQSKSFTIRYQAGTLTYTLDGITQTVNGITEASRLPTGLNTLLIRNRVTSGGTTTSTSVGLSNLAFTDLSNNTTQSLGSLTTSSTTLPTATPVEYWAISGFNGDFQLTGDVSLSWVGTRPTSSASLIFQTKGIYAEESLLAPEPLNILGSILGIGMLGTVSRAVKKRKVSKLKK